ncbi:MAG: hypothetical protein Unbinned8261contig1001_61 [Prokaryotic dsDNA virus sp.]|nr:MAG: hypothetical protein Unbinned8261contig1001_61 [Prokaryotic dsDNA virus sp.]|tara:strand:+ start:10256 stop:11404 length:1149 start_codon:yes stop_codon:yes gene_type:complete
MALKDIVTRLQKHGRSKVVKDKKISDYVGLKNDAFSRAHAGEFLTLEEYTKLAKSGGILGGLPKQLQGGKNFAKNPNAIKTTYEKHFGKSNPKKDKKFIENRKNTLLHTIQQLKKGKQTELTAGKRLHNGKIVPAGNVQTWEREIFGTRAKKQLETGQTPSFQDWTHMKAGYGEGVGGNPRNIWGSNEGERRRLTMQYNNNFLDKFFAERSEGHKKVAVPTGPVERGISAPLMPKKEVLPEDQIMKDPEIQEALSYKKQIMEEGIPEKEQEAFRAKMASQMGRAEQIAGLRMGGILGGAEGTKAASQQRSMHEAGLQARGDIERDILLKVGDIKREGTKDYAKTVGELKKFDISTKGAQKQRKIEEDMLKANIKGAEAAAKA